jgi:hypothetical protein
LRRPLYPQATVTTDGGLLADCPETRRG